MTVSVPLGDAGYDILLGEGLLAQLDQLLSRHCPAAHYGLVTDAAVGALYAEAAARAIGRVAPVTVVSFPAGEPNKTRETWSTLTDGLLAAGLGRDGAIVALGGGVVGDLAGFVAATYLRGLPYVQVPTSLLAMIDSSIGGKTGVDAPAGKNLVGAFHQPRLVVADLATLATLPPRHLAAGMAEAIKHGAIADAAYFQLIHTLSPRVLRGEGAALRQVVERSIAIKAGVVAQDEREHGRRAILNFGHTLAHALEAVTGYQLVHGEAVAIGMAGEARLGEALGITAAPALRALRDALSAYGLPVQFPSTAAPDRMLEAMRQDKKNRAASVRFAFLKDIGEMHREAGGGWTSAAPESAVRDAIGS